MSCSRVSVQPASSCCRCPGQSRQGCCGGLIRCVVSVRWTEGLWASLCLIGHHGRPAMAADLLVPHFESSKWPAASTRSQCVGSQT